MNTDAHHHVLILGGGTGGVTVAARLIRQGVRDIAILEPSPVHYYHPLWSLVGAGEAKAASTVKPTAKVIPRGVRWLHDAAESLDPESQIVQTRGGRRIEYGQLVVATGIQLDWGRTPGLAKPIADDAIASNYTYDTALRTWDLVSDLRGGTAVFTMPSGPIKCAGAPQKACYMSSDFWQRMGVLDNIDVHLVLPTPEMFGIPEYARVLEAVVERYGIKVHLNSEMVAVDAGARKATIADSDSGEKFDLDYDFLHAVPHQSAPDWIKASPIAVNDANGYVDVDKHTLQHVRWPNIYAIGDASNLPTSKTGAAVRKQAPVLVENLLATMAGGKPVASYDGYSSCPIVTGKGKMLLCEFDYDLNIVRTIPFIDVIRERHDSYLLKKHVLPLLYWQGMLKGRA